MNAFVLPNLRDGLERTNFWRNLTEAARSPEEESEMDPTLALSFWCKWLVERTRNNFDAVVVITGDEGQGKSTIALRMALECAKLQKLSWEPTEVCYSAIDLIHAYQKAKKGRPIWFDEGVRGTMAGEQMLPEQRAIVKALALVRESGAILFALYPSIWMASKQIRARRTCLWIHVVHRGLGRVHERDRRLNYLPTDALGLTISPRAPHVAWTKFADNSKAWNTSLATKTARLQEFLHETERDLKMRAEPKPERGAKREREEAAGAGARSESTEAAAEDPAARKKRLGRERVARWRKNHPKNGEGVGVDKPRSETGPESPLPE